MGVEIATTSSSLSDDNTRTTGLNIKTCDNWDSAALPINCRSAGGFQTRNNARIYIFPMNRQAQGEQVIPWHCSVTATEREFSSCSSLKNTPKKSYNRNIETRFVYKENPFLDFPTKWNSIPVERCRQSVTFFQFSSKLEMCARACMQEPNCARERRLRRRRRRRIGGTCVGNRAMKPFLLVVSRDRSARIGPRR